MDNVLKYLIKKEIWEDSLPNEPKRRYSTRELQGMIFDYPEMVDASLINDNFYRLSEIAVDAVNEKIEERDGGMASLTGRNKYLRKELNK